LPQWQGTSSQEKSTRISGSSCGHHFRPWQGPAGCGGETLTSPRIGIPHDHVGIVRSCDEQGRVRGSHRRQHCFGGPLAYRSMCRTSCSIERPTSLQLQSTAYCSRGRWSSSKPTAGGPITPESVYLAEERQANDQPTPKQQRSNGPTPRSTIQFSCSWAQRSTSLMQQKNYDKICHLNTCKQK
jgi:hypothetical protein